MKDRFWFVYMAYGGWQFRKQAVLSILSLAEKMPAASKILVYTDRPGEFENLPVEPRLLTKSRIKSWKGPYAFSHRMKIELLMDLFSEAGGHLLYVDSDTFWTGGTESIYESLRQGCAVMHERERELSQVFFPQYLATIRKTDLLKNAGLPVTSPSPLWIFNAGILGLPSTMNPVLLEEVLRMCDLLSRSVPMKMEWVEQAAFSYIFQSRGMQIMTCATDLLHYWRDSFEFGRSIRKYSREELMELCGKPGRILELVEEARSHRRSFWNQLLVRSKRLERSLRKRKREFLVYLEALKFKVLGNRQP
jgi:hypothetical protein